MGASLVLMPLRTTPTTVGSRRGPCYLAREAAGRPDSRFHDLRHTGAVLAAQTGATLAELMGRLGHSTPQAALRYQHAAQGRDADPGRRVVPHSPGHALTERASSPGGSIVYTPADTLLVADLLPSSKLRLSIPVYKTFVLTRRKWHLSSQDVPC